MSVRVIAREAQVVETMAPIGGRYGDDGDTDVRFIRCCASVDVEAGLSEEKGRGRGDDARAEINKKSVRDGGGRAWSARTTHTKFVTKFGATPGTLGSC